MKILLIGGPKFVGRHLIEAALAQGHDVTLFNRGQTNPGLFPQLEKLQGNRDGGLGVLQGRKWDAVIDTCGYVPRLVRASAEALAASVEHYTFISSISVYGNFHQTGITEDYTLGQIADPTVEQITETTYGPLKVLCEQVVDQVFPGRALHVRAGYIVGPYDPTDRFTYWPMRVARGGQVLAPGTPTQPVQFVDARDLAAWTIRRIEARQAGAFNVTGPASPLTLGGLLEAAQTTLNSAAQVTWVDEAFLQANEVAPWKHLPFWDISSDPDSVGSATVNCAKALAAGLTFRPLSETVRDTVTWASTRPFDYAWRVGLTAEHEADLLQKWETR